MCLIVLAALFSPRFAIVLLWLFTDRMTRAYENGLVPVLGFVFLPWTTFLYGLIQGSGGSVGPLGVIAIIIGLMVDLTTLVGAFGQRRARAERLLRRLQCGRVDGFVLGLTVGLGHDGSRQE